MGKAVATKLPNSNHKAKDASRQITKSRLKQTSSDGLSGSLTSNNGANQNKKVNGVVQKMGEQCTNVKKVPPLISNIPRQADGPTG